MLKYVITGTGRCGTKFASKAFSSAGIPCTHEKVFRVGRSGDVPKGIVADSSWKFLLRPNHPVAAEAIIIHLVRHPLKVIASFLGVPATSDKPGIRKKILHKTRLSQLCRIKNIAERWTYQWVGLNELAERICSARESRFCRIEDGLAATIASLPGETRVPTYANTCCNGRKHPDIMLGDIPDGKWKDEMIKLAERYGYELC